MMPKNPDCACPRDCPRHGDCEACIAFHKTRPNPPDCMARKETARPQGDGPLSPGRGAGRPGTAPAWN